MRHATPLYLIALCMIIRPVFAAETPVAPTAQPVQARQDDSAETAWQNLRSQVPHGSITAVRAMHAAISAQRPAFPQQAFAAANAGAAANAEGAPDASTGSRQPPGIRRMTSDYWKYIAQQSREFLARHPNSEHAQEARKLEITAELVSTPRGSGAVSTEIRAKVAAYLADKSLSASDRFDISAMNREAQTILRVGMGMEEITGRRLEGARELAAEFPDEPRAWANLLDAARRVSLRSAAGDATHIINAAAAPDNIKQDAQVLLDKRARLGTAVAGVAGINVSSASGKPALLYFWTLKQPPFIEFLKLCAKIDGIALVGINVDEDEQAARSFATRHSPPGEQFYEGADSMAAKQLHVSRFPAMLVLDQNGVLLDYPNHTYEAFDHMRQLAGSASQAQGAHSINNAASEYK